MARTTISRPWRSLGTLGGLFALIFGTVAGGVVWSSATWTPNLALDLEGGTQIVLSPVTTNGEEITSNALARSVEIIRDRVNGSGVSEAQVTTQGSSNIVVSLPGTPDQDTIDLVKQAAQLNFRAVLETETVSTTSTTTTTTTPSSTSTSTSTADASASASASETASDGASASAGSSGDGRAVPQGLRADTTSTSTASTTGSASASASSSASSSATPTSASDTAWESEIDPATNTTWLEVYTAEDCSDMTKFQGGVDDADTPFVTCGEDTETGTISKYLLGPSEVSGTDVKTATAGQATSTTGSATGEWVVNLEFTSEGTKKFGTVTQRLVDLSGVLNQFAIVLDGEVISAPTTNEAILTGDAQISGNFTQDSATQLANQLKYGSLPISFTVETQEQISATLGSEQLERGLLAGLIGLVLVVVYSLFQYRALGSVTVASLLIAAGLTYGLVTLLSWREGYRLSLSGVAGLIVAIGITADSFIVYFERVRDEVRDGRSIGSAVEVGWQRAKRTIIVSDAVNFLAAFILYVFSADAVRGFAFTLGLTTLVDIVIVFLFTKPAVVLLSRTRFFGEGHKFSGFDPEHLGRAVAYAGRARVRGGATIAERKAAAAAAGSGATPTKES